MKDLVDHIRTVHFTVFIVALVLTMATQGHRKPHLDRAASDAEAIYLLQQKWPEVDKAIIKTEMELNATSPPLAAMVPRGAQILDVEPGRYILRDQSIYPHRPVIFDVPKKWFYSDGGEPDEGIGWGESQELFEKLPKSQELLQADWNTLKQFLALWDDHVDGHDAFVPFQLATRDGPSYCHGLQRVPQSSARNVSVTAFLIPRATFEKGWQVSASLEAMDYDVDKHRHACDFVAISVSSRRVELGSIFAGIAPQSKIWGEQKSANEFKDLLAEAKYLDESPVAQLAGALRERANADTERVELFQAKLPAEAISTYGALVLIACQLYLLAHLLELRRMTQTATPANWPTGYIGIYDSRFTFAFTLVSMVAWPPFPLLLALRNLPTPTDRFSAIFIQSAFFVSATIAVALATVLTLARRAIQQYRRMA